VTPGLVRLAVGIEGYRRHPGPTWSKGSPPPSRSVRRGATEPAHRGGVLMTVFDVRTATLPAEGEVGLVDIGSLTLENGAVVEDRNDRGAAVGRTLAQSGQTWSSCCTL